MNLSESVLATLAYSAHFHYPLTLAEIHGRLIEHRCSRPKLEKVLSSLREKGKVGKKKGFYFLIGQIKSVESREKRAMQSAPLIKIAQKYATRLGNLPGVRAVYLTGSLAVANSTGNDDIDLMIITENGAVWTTRLIVTVYTGFLGIRRTPVSHDNRGRLCLNLYLSPAGYTIPVSRQSLYSAYELIQAIPLYDPLGTQSELLSSNPWIQKYLPNFPRNSLKVPSSPSFHYSFIERACYTLQKLYMSKRITRELITRDYAFFHPRNPGTQVMKSVTE